MKNFAKRTLLKGVAKLRRASRKRNALAAAKQRRLAAQRERIINRKIGEFCKSLAEDLQLPRRSLETFLKERVRHFARLKYSGKETIELPDSLYGRDAEIIISIRHSQKSTVIRLSFELYGQERLAVEGIY